MKDEQRFRLHFGPYQTPRFKYRDVVWDEARGWVKIVGLTDAPIAWPVGRLVPGGRKGSPVLYKGLAKAVRRESNQAVAHWWGMSGQTVTKWRQALEVAPTTEGTSLLRAACAHEEPIVKGVGRCTRCTFDAANWACRMAGRRDTRSDAQQKPSPGGKRARGKKTSVSGDLPMPRHSSSWLFATSAKLC